MPPRQRAEQYPAPARMAVNGLPQAAFLQVHLMAL